MRNIISIIVLAALVLLVPSAFAQGGSVTLDHVSGVWNDGVADHLCDGLAIFHLRVTNNTGGYVACITNGFRIYSPDGATWDSTRARFAPAFDQGYFDLVFNVGEIDVDGSGEDRIGFSANVMMSPGLRQLQRDLQPRPERFGLRRYR